jgi:hypothetical protein
MTPSEPAFDLTLYPSIFSLDGLPVTLRWSEILVEFTRHLRPNTKDAAPGFGPYRLVERPCSRPSHPPGPHRCDGCVDALSLAVFDVDCGTEDEVAACDARLSGHARLWYSSWSYRPDAERPALRLVVPLARPVPAERWPSWRESFIRAFGVPADPKKCGGLSHFYYAPAAPKDVEPLVDAHEGPFFDPSTIPSTARLRPPTAVPVHHDLDAEVDPERLALLRLRLKQSITGLKRSRTEGAAEKCRHFEHLVAGQPLADHGSRNATTTRVVFQLVRRFGDLTAAEGLAIVEPSLLAMQREGSKLTRETVARMFETAFAKVAAQRAHDERIEALLLERLGMSAASIRRNPSR